MPRPVEEFTHLITTTDPYRDKAVVDNLTNHNALWRHMKEQGNIRTKSSGTNLQMPIEYDGNKTIMNTRGAQTYDTGRSESLTRVKYEWREKTGVVSETRRNILLNQGREKLIPLVEQHIKNMGRSIANHMATEIYGDGSGYEAIGGLESLLHADGMGKVGGIDAAKPENAFWKNQTLAWDEPDFVAKPKKHRAALSRGVMRCTNGTDKPNLIVISDDRWFEVQDEFQDTQRTMQSKTATWGFNSLAIETGVDVIWDNVATLDANKDDGFILNSKYLYLIEHAQAKWTKGEKEKPINQNVCVIPFYWMGQFACTQRRVMARIRLTP